MSKLVTEIVGNEPYSYYPMGKHVVRAPGVCGGRPTFKYTRIEVAGVLSMLASDTIDTIVEAYRGRISREAIEEAILIASRLVHRQKPPKSAAA